MLVPLLRIAGRGATGQNVSHGGWAFKVPPRRWHARSASTGRKTRAPVRCRLHCGCRLVSQVEQGLGDFPAIISMGARSEAAEVTRRPRGRSPCPAKHHRRDLRSMPVAAARYDRPNTRQDDDGDEDPVHRPRRHYMSATLKGPSNAESVGVHPYMAELLAGPADCTRRSQRNQITTSVAVVTARTSGKSETGG